MNTFGLLAGLASLLLIGLGFPLVIFGERILGFRWWPYLLGTGLLLILLSLSAANDWLSVLMGVLGATLAWGSTELKEQAVRAELGWFLFNPKKIRPPFEDVIKKWKAPHL
jgi:hypothetical protein